VLKRIRDKPGKFMRSMSFSKNTNEFKEKWFDGQKLSMSPELNVIIGNKGSGKSALSDSLALLGGSRSYRNFDFLNSEKFRKPPTNRAQYFNGEMKWVSDEIEKKSLDKDPEPHELERVTYIPRDYFETLCNEEKDKLEDEIEKIIFSHIPPEKRQNEVNLKDLIEKKMRVVSSEVEEIQTKLVLVNEEISDLEEMGTSDFVESLVEMYLYKDVELGKHEENKPIKPKKPKKSDKTEVGKRLGVLLKKIESVEDSIRVHKENLVKETERLSLLDYKGQELLQIERRIKGISRELEGVLNASITGGLLSFNFNEEEYDKHRREIKSRIDDLLTTLNPETGLPKKLEDMKEKVEQLSKSITSVEKEYQNYVEQVDKWRRKGLEIIGTPEVEDSLICLSERIIFIVEKMFLKLEIRRKKRMKLMRKLFARKRKVLEEYKYFYKPVQGFVRGEVSGLLKSGFRVQFKAELVLDKSFKGKLLSLINLKSKGEFRTQEGADQKISGFVERADFNTVSGAIEFTESIFSALSKKLEEGDSISSQLSTSSSELYRFVSNLDYLIPVYGLKLNGKDLSVLSPGERGALLIVFYLMMDKNDHPLIIDQPEENLDNQSVFEILVPFVKKAKKRRQLIMVSHNPNLAVVCDAELVIHAELKKNRSNLLSYTTGSIENPKMNKSIVDILEGTEPAFVNRRDKYKLRS
jgi:predicted ATPase